MKPPACKIERNKAPHILNKPVHVIKYIVRRELLKLTVTSTGNQFIEHQPLQNVTS